jgi:hypothetical protein
MNPVHSINNSYQTLLEAKSSTKLNNREVIELECLSRSRHAELLRLAQTVTPGNCWTCLLPEMKTLSLPAIDGIMPP